MIKKKCIKNKTLLKTNILICIIILTGFLTTSIISYKSNIGIFEKDVEMVSTLSSEGLYNEIATVFSQPVSVSLTMANDSLLRDFLSDEVNNRADEKWQARMRDYLNGYRLKYNYDSVFLVSANTNNYYHFEGMDRVLKRDNPENVWYYKFLNSEEEHSLNVDNDEATDNSITVFVNCKIKGNDGSIVGVVGVGLKVNSLQSLLNSYEKQYGVRTYLIDNKGIIQVSSFVTGYENKNLFDLTGYADNEQQIIQNRDKQERFWYSNNSSEGYVVTRYEPNLKWHLVVENDTSVANQQFWLQLTRNILIIVVIVILVLLIITSVIRRYNVEISDLTISQELEYQRLLHEATEGLYDSIYEIDITHNCASSESTRQYFKSMGISPDTPYDKALYSIAGKQIKEEYIQGYVETFCPKAVLESYQNGVSNLNYDFMVSNDRENYQWIRILAQIFYWHSDNSVRMITFQKNVDSEKKRELILLEGIQKDSMTGLYNKRTTEELVSLALQPDIFTNGRYHVFLIFDIDNFKAVNDTMGHSFGDHVIQEIAEELKTQFREGDILGRIGGDEFAVLMKNIDNLESLNQKLTRLCGRIEKKDFGEVDGLVISCSIGVAIFPNDGELYTELYEKADQALYHAKSHGKNSYVMFSECADGYAFHANQRDLELLLSIATDGLAQYACTNPLKLLYFNNKCTELFGIPAAILSSIDYDPMDQIHPDDVEEVYEAIKVAAVKRKPFTRVFRVRHQKGHYVSVRLRGVFINERYKNQYPVFYVMYSKLKD